MLQKEEFD